MRSKYYRKKHVKRLLSSKHLLNKVRLAYQFKGVKFDLSSLEIDLSRQHNEKFETGDSVKIFCPEFYPCDIIHSIIKTASFYDKENVDYFILGFVTIKVKLNDSVKYIDNLAILAHNDFDGQFSILKDLEGNTLLFATHYFTKRSFINQILCTKTMPDTELVKLYQELFTLKKP